MSLKLKNLTPAEIEHQGDIEGRDEYLRENAVALLDEYRKKIIRQAEQLTKLTRAVTSLRKELRKERQRADTLASVLDATQKTDSQ